MTWFFGIMSLMCMGYYGIILLYNGPDTPGAIAWPVFAVLFLGLSIGKDYYDRHRKKVPLWIPSCIVTLLVSSLFVFVVVQVMIAAGSYDTNTEGMDYLIIMDSQSRGGKVNVSLKESLDQALEYSRENPDTILVLSGGKAGKGDVTQAQAMASYLYERGVSRERMLLEMTSSSTVESVISSKVIIDADRGTKKKANTHRIGNYPSVVVVEDKPVQIGILTNSYHVFRTRQCARKWGLNGVYTISSRTDRILLPNLCVRECFAILKDKLMGNM